MSPRVEITADIINAWPGKSMGDGYHPALWHMLDVGAVAAMIGAKQPLTGHAPWNRALVALIALHDLGKISMSFRNQITGQAGVPGRHGQHSFTLLCLHDELIGARLGGETGQRKQFYAAVAGHHGGPPEREDQDRRRRHNSLKAIGSEAQAVAGQMIAAVLELFPGSTLDGLCDADALSWRLSGATVQADWIGSNTDWFGIRPPTIPVSEYWAQALIRAETAVAQAGLAGAHPLPRSHVLPPGSIPRPMQQAVNGIPLPDGPTLALIEDATGAGKTEAALILAHRLLAAGKARGLFLALPTMATSNAMYERVAEVAPRLFDGTPSLGLSHGRAAQNTLFRQIRGNDGSDPAEPVTCGQWLADDRRRILLADIAVGTVDQALLSVLPTRFNTLRLWGLSSKVLIIDEAHAYDPYMEEELGHLLRFHAMLGGSAIVMTATLPLRMRYHYVAQFRKGLGLAVPQEMTSRAYPAVALISSESVDIHEVAPVPATCRDIALRRLDPQGALDVLADGVARGAASVWIRNSVDEAIAAVGDLARRGIAADLLHARFTVADRLAAETALQARFGKDGTGRAGRVLVATQVVEASLDLDFDVMVSDLAPIGSLIQRAGRLWRHMDRRPSGRRPVPGPMLHVVAPDPAEVTDGRWLHRMFPSGAWVYALADQWRTAHVLFAVGRIREPDGLRDLIEAVHGGDPAPVPEVLDTAEIEAEARGYIERGMARNVLLRPEGYLSAAQAVHDEDRVNTRLGVAQMTLALARMGSGGLEPYAETWASSEVSLSRKRYEQSGGVDQARPEIAALKARWPDWRQAMLHVAPVGQGGEIAEGLRYDMKLGLMARPAMGMTR